ncbi:hypothetical protein KRR26_08885 [Corallococcus sp. M34]|uniref:hypothetical protein n=1 Tax=Citreicoccus inhibens TaxID=2849499 RepID=UPI001C239DEE|nr:hypothetical protein [Citreicoccus inhibens]MBU8895718.1 hypothetical protein [Citreicoccus inhibens]
MNPRTLSIGIALTAAAVAVGVGIWLGRPPPPLRLQPVLPEPLLRSFPDAKPSRDVTLSDGVRLPNVPERCAPDDAGSLECRDDCASDADCPGGALCVTHPLFGHRACERRTNLCERARDCATGQVCHAEGTSASGAAVRRCQEDGKRRAGESCTLSAMSPEEACQPGLACVWERCGTPCTVRAPDACPPGWECAPGAFRVTGACVASCREQPCPRGTRCESVSEGGIPLCHRFVGPDCLGGESCAEGQDCLRGFAEPSLETQAFECRARCDASHACPKGLSCDERSGYCLRPCSRDADCAAPERCHVLDPVTQQMGCAVIAEGLPARSQRSEPRP